MNEPDFVRATRASYDAVAADYAARFRGELDAFPLDRALLAGFAELVRAAGAAPIADIGCGAGAVTAYLNAIGAAAFGIDLSAGMIDQARKAYPELRFEVGSMLALDLPEGSLSGIVAWYSTIHVPDEELPRVFGEFARVLVPGGYLLLAFQARMRGLHLDELIGHQVSLDFHQRHPDQVADTLCRAGLTVRARVLREPDEDGAYPEHSPQAFLLARLAK